MWIWELDGTGHTFEWLCRACAIGRRSAMNGVHVRWTAVKQVLRDGKPIRVAGPCADCSMRAQDAPEYVTPTVAFVLCVPAEGAAA